MAANQHPNATLRCDVSYSQCSTNDCYNHATISSTKEGKIVRSCIPCLNAKPANPEAILLKKLIALMHPNV